jgi:methylated-DNA-[protein]-cysteine S-methyltransferase
MLTKTLLPSPLGPILAVASDDGLCGLEFDLPERATRLWRRLGRRGGGSPVLDGHAPVFDAARDWLARYFSSAARSGPEVPLDLVGTDFELAVWRALRAIPPGSTTTYGAIAATLDRRDASRAVGGAVGANPVSLMVPCHRVVGSNGSLTGYGGGLHRKEWLLRHEGALLL